MFYFTLLNQVLHRSRHFFDRHFRINPVLIEEVDGINFEPLERGFSYLLDVLGPAIQSGMAWTLNPNFVAITTRSRKG